MATLAMSTLSKNDTHVLSALFDPESSPSPTTIRISQSATLPHISSPDLPKLQAIEADAVRPLNVPSPSLKVVDDAVEKLSRLLEQWPNYASAYANRAQAVRLRLRNGIYTRESLDDTTRLLQDLARAIALVSPPTPQSPLSALQAKILSAAHSHRGYMLLKAQNVTAVEMLPEYLREKSKEELEEMASQAFFLAGRYGDKVAGQMAVRTNPYAKMCGAIVKGALMEEISGAREINT